jgi:hypothetical protein
MVKAIIVHINDDLARDNCHTQLSANGCQLNEPVVPNNRGREGSIIQSREFSWLARKVKGFLPKRQCGNLYFPGDNYQLQLTPNCAGRTALPVRY